MPSRHAEQDWLRAFRDNLASDVLLLAVTCILVWREVLLESFGPSGGVDQVRGARFMCPHRELSEAQ